MTDGEAQRAMLARWAIPAPDPRDVEERAAVRLADTALDGERPIVAHHQRTAHVDVVRLFVRLPEVGWRSGYVHELPDVDRLLDRIARLA